MSYFGLIVGGMIAAIALVLWYKWHKGMTGGDDAGFFARKSRPRNEEGSLEDFIAAYRRGDVSVKEAAAAAPAVAAGAVPAAVQKPVAAPSGRREPFLDGPTKLAYYLFRSGLRDHHVFAHVRMQSLCTGKLDPAMAEAEISLLVCNAGMSIIAAIDVHGPEPASGDAAKAECLRGLGIRYLKLSARSLPKPGDVRTLLYRM